MTSLDDTELSSDEDYILPEDPDEAMELLRGKMKRNDKKTKALYDRIDRRAAKWKREEEERKLEEEVQQKEEERKLEEEERNWEEKKRKLEEKMRKLEEEDEQSRREVDQLENGRLFNLLQDEFVAGVRDVFAGKYSGESIMKKALKKNGNTHQKPKKRQRTTESTETAETTDTTELRPGGESTGIIYALTCPSGKRYVGKTTRSLSKRASEHAFPTSGCRLIRDALKAHGGLDAFKTEVLVCCSLESLDANESLYIERLDTLHPRGYNLRAGSRAGYASTSDTTLVPFDESRIKLETPEEKGMARAIVAFAVESDLCGEEPAEEPESTLRRANAAIKAIAEDPSSAERIAGDYLAGIGEM